MFNARSESISEKASFRRLIPKNRCLVTVEGTPVILGDEISTASWLSGSSSKLDNLLKPYEKSDLAWYPATPEMGKPSFDGPECIKEIPLKKESTTITKFFAKKGPTDYAKEPKPLTESAVEEPAKIDLKKEELEEETEVKPHVAYVTSTDETELKPSSIAAESLDPGHKCSAKREFQEFNSDTKVHTSKLHASPAKKKSKSETENAAANMQPTLFSFMKKV